MRYANMFVCRTADGWQILDSVYLSIAKSAPSGSLLAYYPHNGSTHVLMDGLWFANGVALSADESFVAVADSLQAKIHRWGRTGWSGTCYGSRFLKAVMQTGPDCL